ncbi:MAG: ATP-binding cassette domain-containing protein [Treponema sp.]|uniref:ABC transporter ATP-binding protein n=1 Tax=Treponema sp. TaxID=166 RepID=UPI0025DC718B|nr:ATP-binding cassette domain-containing protein [Treponema sp.]MBR0496860.1 ATP-binding cassette domain-containing protein [Treponema sp.]
MIEIKSLTKEFKTAVRKEGVRGMFKTLFSTKYEVKSAVNNISLKINDGEMVGYIGSNGAGKSTTIKMMCGILTPTRGFIEIDGVEPYKKRKIIASKIGVVFGQKTQLWWDIPLIESFKVLKEIYRISDSDYQERLNFLYEVLGIKDFVNQPVRTLSLGQRMRADLAAAWLHNPKILFLDEPTIGLDVLVKEKIRNAIKMMNEKFNTTVILTTHDMKDIEDLCKRIIIIDKGNIIYDGTLENVKYRFGDLRTLTVTLRNKKTDNELYNYEGKLKFLRDEENENKLIIKFNAQEITLETVINYAFNQLGATDMKVEEIGIEDVVKRLL